MCDEDGSAAVDDAVCTSATEQCLDVALDQLRIMKQIIGRSLGS
jgi:hypothetical protein